MEAILPLKIKNEQKFFDCALKVGYNEMEIYKFIYVMQQSDLDTFPKMHDERINVLLYGWELCEDYKQKHNPAEWELPEELETILKLLVPWSMDIWFSKEWDKCKSYLRTGLIHCLNRARDLMMRMPDMMQINWDFLLLYNLTPWNVPYLKNLTVTKDKTLENGAQSIETEELPATDEDISYIKLEQLPLIVLRLVKLFDQSSIDMVKTLCMRVIAAWNKVYQKELENSGRRLPYVPPEDKKCLMLICHIYLMGVYEADDVKGYVIDNMINNIRFYYQGFQNSTALYAMDNLEYTPARFIALTNIHLRVQKRDFFDFFIWNKYDTSPVNLFGVVSQAYKSYLLGNLLMELNNMNEDDFAANIPLYKRLMNSYVNEREKSELFLLNELQKLELQHYAHNIIQNVKNITDFKNKICKGNRMSNIGNYENSDDTMAPLIEIKTVVEPEKKVEVNKVLETKDDIRDLDDAKDEETSVKVKENELRLDPIFQNLPNNENILYYVYEVLAKKDYKGWHFAKVVLLMKIIDHELNMIETWRYHPGLTTDFMLNLEVKLSRHYVDLAKIFKDHALIEQEFWLTAFYLNPIPDIYETIKRIGMRNNRKRTEDPPKLVMTIDNVDAKYGLLSSTIDVKEIASLANTDDPYTDYQPLYSVLHSLRVPDSLIKDMITAIFLPRNKSFAWVIDWNILRTRCKMIMTSMKEKKRFVELNMAEANDRLKYLIIDYEKYKNRPQLDYGTIEEGYENLMNSGDFDKETDDEVEEEDGEEEDFEDDEDVYENKSKGRGGGAAAARKKEAGKVEDDNSQEDDPFLMGKRRTRARTAATLASLLFQTLPRSSRRKKNEKEDDDKDKTKSNEEETGEKSSESKSPITTSESLARSPLNAGCDSKDSQIANVPTKNIKEYLQDRPAFSNSTDGFQHLIDIWNVEKTELQTIDENCISLMESSNILQRAVKWKSLNKEINPLGCNEQEHIDDNEMVIENVEMPIKKEYNFNMVTPCLEEVKPDTEEILKDNDLVVAMDVVDEQKVLKNDNIAEPVKAIDADLQEASISIVTEEKINENEQIEETPHVEDNSESINSDESTEAQKDSEEISESNTEGNSKRNSFNNDLDTMDKIELCKDLNELNDDSSKINDIEETEQEQRNDIEEMKTSDIIEESNIDEEQEISQNENIIEPANVENSTNSIAAEQCVEEEMLENETKEKENLNVEQNMDKEDLDLNDDIETFDLNVEQNMDKEDLDLNDDIETFDKDIPKELNEVEEAKDDGKAIEETTEEKCNEIIRDLTEKNELSIKDKDDSLNIFKEDESITEEMLNEDDSISKANDFDVENIKCVNDIELIDTKSSQDFETENNNDINSEEIEDLNTTISTEKLADIILDSEQSTEVKTVEISPTYITTALEEPNIAITIVSDINSILHYSPAEEDLSVAQESNNDLKLCENKLTTPFIVLDESTADSIKTTENSTDSETRNLKNICLTQNVQILVRRLRAEDLTVLRQPKVKIKRVNPERYAEEIQAKRKRVTGKVYLHLDDDSSSNSCGNNTSSSDTYRPPKVKRKIPLRRQSIRHLRLSESDNDSNTSEDMKLAQTVTPRIGRIRRVSTPSTSQSSTKTRTKKPIISGPKSARHKTSPGPKSSKTTNLVVTPRSASGLKLRISHAETTPQLEHDQIDKFVYDEIIQLSSSSSDECIINDLTVIEEEMIEIEDNPLFEEEIII